MTCLGFSYFLCLGFILWTQDFSKVWENFRHFFKNIFYFLSFFVLGSNCMRNRSFEVGSQLTNTLIIFFSQSFSSPHVSFCIVSAIMSCGSYAVICLRPFLFYLQKFDLSLIISCMFSLYMLIPQLTYRLSCVQVCLCVPRSGTQADGEVASLGICFEGLKAGFLGTDHIVNSHVIAQWGFHSQATSTWEQRHIPRPQ